MSPTTRRAVAVVGLPLLVAAATGCAVLALAGDLPDPVGTHVAADGTVDGTLPLAGLLAATLGIQVAVTLVLGAVAWSVRRAVAGARPVVALPAATVAFLGALIVGTLLPQRGLDDALDASIDPVAIPVALGVAVLVGLLAAGVAPSPTAPATTRAPAPADVHRVDLGGGAGVWHGTTRPSPAMTWLLVGLGGLTVVLSWLAGPLVVVPVMLVAVVALGTSLRFTVTLGPGGVGVRSAFGWPRTQLGLDAITQATVEDVSPMAYGGWGWRLRGDRTAVVTARGPGLVLHRTDGSALVVTVEDADDAAGVVNRLLDRRAVQARDVRGPAGHDPRGGR